MIIYLDQNYLIDLTKDSSRLNALSVAMSRIKASLGLSFGHIVETIHEKKNIYQPIIDVVERLNPIELVTSDTIITNEVKNEFYRFLNLKDKIRDINTVGKIFSNTKIKIFGFRNIIEYFSSRKDVIEKNFETKVNFEKKALSLPGSKDWGTSLKNERDNLLNFYIEDDLTPQKVNLKVKLPARCLDTNEFKAFLDWERCPYLNFKTLFTTLKIRDKKRNAKNDLIDFEHASIGSLSCDILCIEKNSFEIIRQVIRHGIAVRAKIFRNIDDVIKSIL